MSKGGARKGAGRRPKGIGKVVKLTLPQEVWDQIEIQELTEGSKAATIRRIVMKHFGFKEED